MESTQAFFERVPGDSNAQICVYAVDEALYVAPICFFFCLFVTLFQLYLIHSAYFSNVQILQCLQC